MADCEFLYPLKDNDLVYSQDWFMYCDLLYVFMFLIVYFIVEKMVTSKSPGPAELSLNVKHSTK